MKENLVINILTSLAAIYYVYEILYKGSKVLIFGEDLKVFPFNLFEWLAKVFSKKQYLINELRQKKMIFWGVFFSGMMVPVLLIYLILFFMSLSSS